MAAMEKTVRRLGWTFYQNTAECFFFQTVTNVRVKNTSIHVRILLHLITISKSAFEYKFSINITKI